MGPDKLKEAFAKADKDGNGKIDFDGFLWLLRKGHPSFNEEQAEELFYVVDRDLSGEIDFHEFVDYLYDNKSMQDFILPKPDDPTEEDAKAMVMATPLKIRSEASKAVKARGEKWSNMTWKERLEEINYTKGSMSPSQFSPQATGLLQLPEKERAPEPEEPVAPRRSVGSLADALGDIGGGGGMTDLLAAASMLQASQDDEQASPKERRSVNSVQPGATRQPTGTGNTGHAMSSMSQSELTDYSLTQEDIGWAGTDCEVLREMKGFKEHLRTAGGPFDAIEMERYVAKGTAGWVFQVRRKSTGERVALKLIRMTQVRTGIKEWYVSKLMREEGLANIVFTDETSYVLERSTAPDIVQEELKDAGPVPYYVCFVQEFVDGGTLEGLAQDGKLTPPMLLQAMKGVAATLAKLHERNIAHRDMKPENVLVKMQGDALAAVKLCDFGRAEIGDSPEARADDVRRFGVTLFSLATGEGWTANRLIHEDHSNLVERLREAVAASGQSALQALPKVLQKILDGGLEMSQVLSLLQGL